MRDVALTIILLGIVPLIFYRPHVGVLAWAWVAFMNPHREVYSYLARGEPQFIYHDPDNCVIVFLSREMATALEPNARCDDHICGLDHADDIYSDRL